MILLVPKCWTDSTLRLDMFFPADDKMGQRDPFYATRFGKMGYIGHQLQMPILHVH
jgi:hypothetical protein